MKKIAFSYIIFIFSLLANADNHPLWLHYCKISPDGKEIAFCFKGDIYKVPVGGGRAVQLTSNPAYDTRPIWSPDGKYIAFASDRYNNFDVYLLPSEGGEPRRLTHHTTNEYPLAFEDSSKILYSAYLLPDSKYGQFPSGQFPQVYEINKNGGRATLFSSLTMEDISVDNTGKKFLYHDKKGYENYWRKHHRSSVTRDIWLYDKTKNGTFTKLTTFIGEDRNPVWSPDNRSFYYLSEQDSTSNIYKRDLNSGNDTELTHFKGNPVRFLSVGKEGTLCFSYQGEIYTMKENEEPRKVDISIVADNQERKTDHINFSSGASEMSVSPNGKEIAFIVRGDIFVASTEYGTTKRITNTPEQERSVSFSPDGRSLVYASERNGMWNIYRSYLDNKDDSYFTYAKEIKEEQITNNDSTSFQPLYSPDGKEIAYLENRTTLKVLNLKSKKSRTVLEGKYNYSYSDGDQWFRWSPDSKWILTNYIGIGGWNNIDIALVNADGSGQLTNLTESGYTDSSPRFAMDGKAMLWLSDKEGYRSHGSWGSYFDAYLMFFDRKAYDTFKMSKEELAMEEQNPKVDKEKDKKGKGKDKQDEKKKSDKKIKPLVFNLENREDRIVRLTPNSSNLSDAVLNKKGDKIYYLSSFERGYDLWVHDLKDQSSKILAKDVGAGDMQTDSEGKIIYLLGNGQLKKIDMEDGKLTPINIKAEFTYHPEEERQYIFEHVWQQVKDKFYDPKMHGIDWPAYKKDYARFLPYINNNYDFTELLSEMLGELNGSHTGAFYFPQGPSLQTASLGAFFDKDYKGEGLKVKEIIQAGPLTDADLHIDEGSVILKIDGQDIQADKDYSPLLEGKADKNTLITYKNSKGKQYEEWIKPVSSSKLNDLLYKRWVNQRREMVDKLSGGKIGYVHVKAMDSESFREVYSELLGRNRNKEAVIVDTRHNGGGWLHDDLATLLSGKEYIRYTPRGQYIGSDPYNKWTKPSVVLICEDNYSNAHGFPWVYKELKIGKLIGAPVPGTMTAVWWERQINPQIIFGIPQVGAEDERGQYLENHELEPDIKVYNDPESLLKGEDQQIEAAVKELLKGTTK